MVHDEGMTDDDDAPGWDAIDAALRTLYPGVEPRHVGYNPPAAVSHNLQGCSAYPANGHWHYVTFGLSELYDKDAMADPEWSGWGFELTMRVARGAEALPVGWPFAILNQVANYVNRESAPVADGDRTDLQRAVTGFPDTDGPDTGLTVLAFTVDPQLGTIDTPNGRVTFLQAVGVTAEEKTRMRQSSTAEVIAELARDNPLLVTDPARAGIPRP
jgi:hypothetical protein